jgi:hypothetical protein
MHLLLAQLLGAQCGSGILLNSTAFPPEFALGFALGFSIRWHDFGLYHSRCQGHHEAHKFTEV